MSASTVILNGLTTHDYGTYYPYFAIRNDSGGVVYASTTDPECTPDTEGVVSIANGDGYMAANTDNDNTCLYLSGTGKVTVVAQHDKIFPFKVAQGGGDDETVIDTTINAESTNAHAAGSKAVYDFVTEAIAGVGTFHAEIVDALPLAGASNILYLVAKASSESGNVYDEYLYISGAWELIGSTDIDLSGYAKSSEMQALAAEIEGKIPTKVSELENDVKYITSDTELRFSVVDGILNVTYDDGGNA